MIKLGKSPAKAAVFAALILAFAGCAREPAEAVPRELEPIKAEAEETERPAKKEERPYIKVKRDKDGEYSWEISGKDAKAILEADHTLRRRLASEKKGE